MAFYKAIGAKNNQKIELILQYNSIEEAREYLHKQGYSIIELKETSENIHEGDNVFYFDALIDGIIKHGSIGSDDIFKAYIKLVDNIGYDVIYIYDKKDCEEREKILITQKIKNSYIIYKNSKSNIKKVEQKKEETQNLQEKENKNIENKENVASFLTKELEYYYNLIDKVGEKIEFILNNFYTEIQEDRKNKLIELNNALKQVKNITNLTKLKAIGELALIKVGELQKEFIENNVLEIKKEILVDTNKLLKSFGSSRQIILPEDDLKLKINNFINDSYYNFISFFKGIKKKDKIDKNSGKYYDILREQNIYINKLRDLNKQLFKALFNKELYTRLILKKKLIKQNIILLENRIKNKKISYTKTIKGFNYYKDIIIYLIQKLADIIIYSIFIYSIFFIIINKFFIGNENINYNFILYIVLFSFLGFFLKISKNFTLFIINSFIYFVLFIYFLINF